MDLFEKLEILSDAAKYDAACTSSGIDRSAGAGQLGNCMKSGICHTFSADGRCVTLLKVLLSNSCVYDCKYCVNRRSNDHPRASFEPRELADLTIEFYRRNYIEGLFLSSGVLRNPDYTTEMIIETLRILREEHRFSGYIHAKAIPGADDALTARVGLLCDRLSVNIELPSQKSLSLLAPDKQKADILRPMSLISAKIKETAIVPSYGKRAARFAPAGQSTQMIVGASPETDYQILRLTQGLYRKYSLKRVFFSAYLPVSDCRELPSPQTKPPLLREHRLYQADWLLRYYGFTAEEILDEQRPYFNPMLDPKCNWAVNHMEQFPVEVNSAPYEQLLRVPGVGVKSAQRIVAARRGSRLDFDSLRRIGVVLKRAQYFLLCGGKVMDGLRISSRGVLQALVSDKDRELALLPSGAPEQLSLFDAKPKKEEVLECLTGQI